MRHKVTHGMASAKARRVQLTGTQLKLKFKSDHTIDGLIPPSTNLNGIHIVNPATYSLKAGDNWQFHLGRFSELDEIGFEINGDGKFILFKDLDRLRELFYSGYMFKNYAFAHDLFVCFESPEWMVFKSEEIINYLTANMRVRILDSGRIKVDIFNDKKFLTIFTLEYRAEAHKKSFVFGAHGGGAGKRLRKILSENCCYSRLILEKDSSR